MDTGKQIGGTAAIDAARLIAAPDPIGLLTPKGELGAADGLRPSLSRTPPGNPASSALPVSPTVAELSPGAQLLLKLLVQGNSLTPPLRSALPLLPEPPPALADGGNAGAVIARALQSGLEHSGLFYESHLADWVAGQRSLDAICAEPQAVLRAEASMPAAGVESAPDNSPPTAPAISQLVNAQLDVIDSGQLRWQGELWPGVPVEIRLQRDAKGKDTADANRRASSEDGEASHHWQARLVTTLPVLGKISTQFMLQDDRLDLKLSCAEPATAAALQVAAPELAGTLQATGLTLQGFSSHANNPC